jgi:hypothetical protein
VRWCTYSTENGKPRVGLVDGGTIRGLAQPDTLIEVLSSPQALAVAVSTARSQPSEVIGSPGANIQAADAEAQYRAGTCHPGRAGAAPGRERL